MFALVLKSPNGEWPITYTYIRIHTYIHVWLYKINCCTGVLFVYYIWYTPTLLLPGIGCLEYTLCILKTNGTSDQFFLCILLYIIIIYTTKFWNNNEVYKSILQSVLGELKEQVYTLSIFNRCLGFLAFCFVFVYFHCESE